jgi:hypothetical protein
MVKKRILQLLPAALQAQLIQLGCTEARRDRYITTHEQQGPLSGLDYSFILRLRIDDAHDAVKND